MFYHIFFSLSRYVPITRVELETQKFVPREFSSTEINTSDINPYVCGQNVGFFDRRNNPLHGMYMRILRLRLRLSYTSLCVDDQLRYDREVK